MALFAVSLVAVALGIALAVLVLRRFWLARSETHRIRNLFSRYVSSVVVDEILTRKDVRIFEGREGYATVLYCRIWNFGHFAETLSPDETLRYLNEFYTLAGKSIQKHRGMIDKFLGDGIMGVFGMPLDDPFKEEHAIRAALDIIRLVAGMDARWIAQGRQPLRVGIGINSGNMIAGDTGFLDRREYTVVGNEALVASRLQEETETLNAYVLVSAGTYEPVRDIFTAVPAGGIPLRGMRRIQPAFVIRGLTRHRSEDALLLPRPNAFRQTTIARDPSPAEERARANVDAILGGAEPVPEPQTVAAGATAPPPAPAPAPPAPPPPPAPARPVRPAGPPLGGPRVEPPAREFSVPLDLPELRTPRLRTFDDDAPAMPEAPGPSVTYEDKDGPPLQLPP